MSRKNFLTPFPVIASQSMGADINGEVTDVSGMDNIAFDFRWTGTPTGDFQVQARVGESGEWFALDIGTGFSCAGSAGNHQVNLNQLPFTHVRPRYIRSSGTGTLTVRISGKAV